MAFRPTIGLEIHAELRMRTKMFCDSANHSSETRPNVNVCPICLAHPGTLPVINREAVRHILRLGAAIGGTLAGFSEFDRKSYFYPDMPKGYQISQYEHPLVSGGTLAGVAITRIHLEEDTARSTHVGAKGGGPERIGGAEGKTLVDFNRAGIPLMELVTEPVIPDAKTAGTFARELQLLLRTLGASEANLEKGEMRIEANVSVRSDLKSESSRSDLLGPFGTKVEIKNLNSFRSVERAIAFEIERQSNLLSQGGRVEQETRGWDEVKQQTFHQRFKEGSADYRYFPEPDLPSLSLAEIPEFSHATLTESLPELPWVRRARYREQLGLKDDDIEYLLSYPTRSEFFDAVVSELDGQSELVVRAANYFISDLAGEPGKATPAAFAALIRMLASGKLSSRGAKDVLALLGEGGGDPETIAQMRGLTQVTDASALAAVVDTILTREVAAVGQYRAGKTAALEYLVGQAMRASRGAGNPQALRHLFKAKLGDK